MAIPIVPKSEIRYNDNVSVGYGELPSIGDSERRGWVLPCGSIVYNESEARKFAAKIDQMIRASKKFDPKKLAH